MSHTDPMGSETDSIDPPPNRLLESTPPTAIGTTMACEMQEDGSFSPEDDHVRGPMSQMDEPAAQTFDGTASSNPAATALQEDSNTFVRIERETFLLFVKVLFKVLEDDPRLKTQARNLVLQCRRRSQRGDPAFQPLMGVVERHLRILVGERKWRQVHLLVHHRMGTVEGVPRIANVLSC